jgi:hypothetical protein
MGGDTGGPSILALPNAGDKVKRLNLMLIIRRADIRGIISGWRGGILRSSWSLLRKCKPQQAVARTPDPIMPRGNTQYRRPLPGWPRHGEDVTLWFRLVCQSRLKGLTSGLRITEH